MTKTLSISFHLQHFGKKNNIFFFQIYQPHFVFFLKKEIALFNKMTIEETLSYFGRIHRMSRSKRKSRMEFLLQFLTLPEADRLVENLR